MLQMKMQEIFLKPRSLPPREEVRWKIPAGVYVQLHIYTFIFPVIQMKIARPTCQTCEFLPKQYRKMCSRKLVSRIQSLVKQQEFSVLAMPCQLYVGQEFVRFHVGMQMTWTMIQIQMITYLSIQDLTDIQMHLVCKTKQFLRVLVAVLLNSTYTMEKLLQVVTGFC